MTTGQIQAPVPYDPNEGAEKGTGLRLPSSESMFDSPAQAASVINASSYVDTFFATVKSASDSFTNWIGKAVTAVAPGFLSFARITYMPDQYNSGLLQKPGIAFESLMKIARENIAPQLIIGMRCDDVMRYSTLSDKIWRPGWTVEPIQHKPEGPSKQEKKEILEAIKFLQMGTTKLSMSKTRERDAHGLTNFQRFLSAITRDTLTVDGIAIWTSPTHDGQITSFAFAPASQIRLVNPQTGYAGNKSIFAVAVNEANTVIHQFTREDLVYYTRNVWEVSETFGYGKSELEVGARLIQGFQNALDLNVDTFNRSAIPNGIMVLSGETVTQKQLDLLNRMWTNLKKGVTKSWTLPVIGLSGKDSKVEILHLNDIKGMEVYYQDFMNMIIGAFSTLYRFPIRRIGYRISGKGKDTEPVPDSQTTVVDDDDPGLAPLLTHLENVINEYLIWSNWPDLRFRFNGKNPKEDARGYEALKNARTWGEERADAGLPPLEDLPKIDGKMKKLAKLLTIMPADQAKQGAFQSLAAALFTPKPEGGAGKPPGGGKTPKKTGSKLSSKKDPAKSEDHGGTSGVRRNSRAEKIRAGAKKSVTDYSPDEGIDRDLPINDPDDEEADDE